MHPLLAFTSMGLCLGGALSLTTFGGSSALSSAPERIAYLPEAEATFEKRTSIRQQMRLVEIDVEVGGESRETPQPNLELTQETTHRVRDRLLSLEGGRPKSFERTFLEAHFEVEVEHDEGAETEEHDSPLVDLPLRFEREGDGWSVRYAEDGGVDDAWLEGLRGDADALAFLPPEGSELGARWQVPAAHAFDLLRPFGRVYFDQPLAGWGKLYWRTLLDLEGDIDMEWVAHAEHDGRRLAVFAVDFDLEGRADDSQNVGLAGPDGEEFARADMDLWVETRVLGEGRILWDVAGGHLLRFELEAEIDTSQHEVLHLPGEVGGEVRQRRGFEGRLDVSFEQERS
jgi:hypothetical protein